MNYRLRPCIDIHDSEGTAYQGWEKVGMELAQAVRSISKARKVIVVEVYPGADLVELQRELLLCLNPDMTVLADDYTISAEEINAGISRNLTDDRVFGIMDHSRLEEFFDWDKIETIRTAVDDLNAGTVLVLGTGASLICNGDVLVYADITRWEIQLRWRRGEACNWMADNYEDEQLKKYKRGFFFEWRMADRRKQELFDFVDYFLDANVKDEPKLICGDGLRDGLRQVAQQPFSMVPYFDSGVWGGQWMKEHFGLDASADNFAWSFNGVPEENSLCLQYGDVQFELPAINLVFYQTQALLGEKVHARFGKEFPIRFDFLDTMGGGNLSLQVHPLTEYIQDRFGMHYTQDESYYIMDVGDSPNVYLGIKSGVKPETMIDDLRSAQTGDAPFPAEQYVNKIPVKKHDHILIPAGTIHCSGRNTMVLEISATPYIFTFKLWDWDRLGLDGRPRPIHIDHGVRVIQWERNTDWVQRELTGQVKLLKEGEGWLEERTGLHEREFIETRRLWLTQPVKRSTGGGVQMLMVVDGEGCIISSPENKFKPFTANYAECFIIPASVDEYYVSPLISGQQTGVICAYVRC